MIGIIWLFLTVIFEFFMELVLSRKPLSKVRHDYNLLEGRVWVLFLVWITLPLGSFTSFRMPANRSLTQVANPFKQKGLG